MSPPPPRRDRGDRPDRGPRGDRPEREPIDPFQALENLYAKKVITLEEGKAAAQFIDPNAVFPRPPPEPAAAPPSPPASAPPAPPSPPADEAAPGSGSDGASATEVPRE